MTALEPCHACTGTGMETTDPEDASRCRDCNGTGVHVGLLHEFGGPDVRCQRPGCGYQLRRDVPGNLMHVTDEGQYIYIDHHPVLPQLTQPKEQ